MAQTAFVVTHADNSYTIPAKSLPRKGQHSSAASVEQRTHAVHGDYLAFNVTCNARSREPGRCYCVYYFVRDGYVQYFTVN